MDMFIVRGGTRLSGSVTTSGSKNATLPIMAAAIAADGPLQLTNVPDLVDVRTLAELLTQLGLSVERSGDRCRLEVVNATPHLADYDLVRRMRAGVCVLGPLLARRKRACVSLPGGCNIGHRPVDLHLKGLAALGADIRVERGYIFAEARQLQGTRISLAGPFGSTVTGTCNVMTAAALASGVTIIDSAACEPEVVDLARCLSSMGARIEGAGTPTLRIEGVSSLHAADHHIIPDRIEAATLMCAAAITAGDITLHQTDPAPLTTVCELLHEIGVEIHTTTDALHVVAPQQLRPVDFTALPYPGIPTDLQAQLMALLTQASGVSIIRDGVFPDRFMHVSELVRMGAAIRRQADGAIVEGPVILSGANVMASDLRASAALVLAALAARGETVVRRIYHLDRGYERLDLKLTCLGASIARVPDRPENTPASLIPQA